MCPPKALTSTHPRTSLSLPHFCYISDLMYHFHPEKNLHLSGLKGTLEKNPVLTCQEKHLANYLTSPCLSFLICQMQMIRKLHWLLGRLNDFIHHLNLLESFASGNNAPMLLLLLIKNNKGFPGGAVVESLPANAGDTGSSPGLGRSHVPQSN